MNVFDLSAKINLNTDDYKNKLNEAGESSSSFASKLGSGIANGVKVATGLLATASAGVVAFGKSAVDAGTEFDKAMSQVSATMGITNAELNATTVSVGDFTGSLRDFAQKMGSETAFSATQCAEALNFMALAGYDAETSVSMLPNVLNLASAGGMELASASDMVTDAQTALGLSIEETTVMVDMMAKASAKSNTSVSQLGEAILSIGGTAKLMKGGTNELTTTLGILADNGIKGSEGGTKLRNVLMSLANPTQTAETAMALLGKDLKSIVYDAESGEMRSMVDIFADLNEVMADMTDAERTALIGDMFNKQDLSAVNALLDTSVERWGELSEAIDASTGSAQAMANTQLDNLAGDVTLFKSALEGAQIAVAEGLTPTMREFVQFGADGLSKLTNAFKEEGIGGAVNALGDILTNGLMMITDMLPSIIDAGMQILTALIDGIVKNIPQLVSVTLQLAQTLADGIIENLPVIIEGAIQIVVGLAKGITEMLPTLIPVAVQTIITIVETLLDNIDLVIDTAIELIFALAEGLINALPILIEKAPEIIIKLVDAFIENFPKVVEAGIQLIGKLAVGILSAIPEAMKAVTKVVDALVERLESFVSRFSDVGGNMVAGIWEGIRSKWTWLTDKVTGLVDGLVGGIKGFLGIESPSKVFKGIGGYMAEGLGIGWGDEFKDVQKDITNSLDFEAQPVKASNVYANAGMDVDALTEAFTEALGTLKFEWDDRNLGRMVKSYA